MGRRNRERIERIRAGSESPIDRSVLENPVSRKVVTVASRRGIIGELSKGTTTERTGRLSELVEHGILPQDRLRDAIVRKAPREMDKAIRKFRKGGKEITVDSLLAEVRSEPGFVKMCENIGLAYDWFEELARERMKAAGVLQVSKV